MKIAFVCPHFYPHIGGVETVVFQLASNLAAKGIKVSVLTQTNDKHLPKKEKLNNFTIHRFYEFGFSKLKISIGLLRYLQKNSKKYDLIHAQNYHSFPAFCAAFTKQKPVVFSPHYHGTGSTSLTYILNYPYRSVGWFIFSKSDAILCDTDAESKLLKKHFPHIKSPTIIPLGIDVAGIKKAAKIKSSSKYIISVGRLENYKNVELIIKSLEFIKNDLGLKIIGNGPEKKHLQDLTQKLKLSSHISFLNNISDDELHSLLKSAKVYVTMSNMEAYGLSLLEAVAAEIGIVASDIPAHMEQIKKYKIKHITLLNPNSPPKALAHSITQAIEHPAQAKEKLPSWDLVSDRIIKVYKKILDTNKN